MTRIDGSQSAAGSSTGFGLAIVSSRRGLHCSGCRRGRNINLGRGRFNCVDRMWTSDRDVFTVVYVDELCVKRPG